MSNNIPLNIQNGTSFDGIQDGQLCYEGNKIVYRDGDNRIDLFDTYDSNTANETFLKLGTLPIDRFGDNTYLPLDIKGDFKGPVVPQNSKTVVIRENDGSLVGLRPGYNANFQHLFYIYSQSGIFNQNDVVITDQLYDPLFLRKDQNDHEFVSRILSANKHGMLVEIKNYHIQNYTRYFWINFNDTMDAQYHSYIDVTSTLGSYGIKTLVFVPEMNMFVGSADHIVKFHFFNNNLPIQWGYINPNSISTTLTQKTMTVNDPVTNTTYSSNTFLNGSPSNYQSYLTVFPNANGNIPASVLYPAGGNTHPQFVYQYDGSNIYGYIRYSTRIVFTDGQARNFSIVYRIRITATGVVSMHIEDSSEQQTFPYVFDHKTFPNTYTSGTAEELKANRYPLLNGYDYFLNESLYPETVGTIGIAQSQQANTYSVYYYIDTPTRLYVKKPFIFGNIPQYNHNIVMSYTMYPPDASVLGKRFTNFSFISAEKFQVVSSSYIVGDPSISDKLIEGTLSPETYRTLDYGNTVAVGLPSSANVYPNSDLFLENNAKICTVYDKSTNKYRTLPYNFTVGNNLNNLTVHIFDENRTIDTTMHDNGVVVKFPANAYLSLTNVLNGILGNTNLPNPTDRASTITYINTNNGTANLLMSYSASTYAYTSYIGMAIISCPVINGVLDLSNSTVNNFFSQELPNAQIYANTQSATGSYGIYYSDISIFINLSGAGYSTVGGNAYPNYAVQIGYNGNVIQHRYYTQSASWIQGNCGVHPVYGWYNTNVFDNFQTRVYLRRNISTAVIGSARIEDTFNKLFAGEGISSMVVLTTEPPSSFNLYTSSIPLQFQGYSYVLPPQSLNFLSLSQNPYNKKFWFYVKRNELGDVVLDISEYQKNETVDNMYIGFITTTSTNINLVSINKRTRINLFGLSSFDALSGNSIQYNDKLTPDTNIDAEVKYGLMFDDLSSTFYRALFTPPTSQTILSTWARTDGQNYYTNPSTIPSTIEASKWYIAGGSFVQPNNTANLNTILSPEYLDRYTFEATLNSTDSDDDYIGLVIAADYINGEYISLIAGIHPKGLGASVPRFSIQLYRNGVNTWGGGVIIGEDTLSTLSGWSGNSIKIKIVKDRNNITVYRGTNWNTNEYSEGTKLSLDIYSLDPELHFLADKMRYGFATLSQAGSRYLNYNITLPVSYDTGSVYNTSNQKYMYDTANSQWVLSGNASQDFNYPRVILNPATNAVYKFEQDGSSRVVRGGDITGSPTITLPANTTSDVLKSIIEQQVQSPHGIVELIQVVQTSNVLTTDSGSSISIQTYGSSGYFYAYFKSGDAIAFIRISVNV